MRAMKAELGKVAPTLYKDVCGRVYWPAIAVSLRTPAAICAQNGDHNLDNLDIFGHIWTVLNMNVTDLCLTMSADG